MRNKILILLGILVLGTALAACGPSAVTVQPQPPQRTLTVTGTGTVTLTPDIAYVYIGVHTQDASASKAVTENSTKSQVVFDALKKLGVDLKDIQTSNISIYPQQQTDDKSQITGILYMVDNTVFITIRHLEKLGDLLDAVIKAGANNINSIQFDLADKTDALSKARLAAVTNAKKQAQELADATGVKLGEIQTISYYDSTPPIAYDMGKGGGGGGVNVAMSVPVSSGQLQITTTVTINYELK